MTREQRWPAHPTASSGSGSPGPPGAQASSLGPNRALLDERAAIAEQRRQSFLAAVAAGDDAATIAGARAAWEDARRTVTRLELVVLAYEGAGGDPTDLMPTTRAVKRRRG